MVSGFTVETVRTLKGAPLSIMVALSLVGTAVSNDWLVANTGYTGKPVSIALMYLREHGYIVLTTRGWRLAGNERQLPLSAQPLAPDPDPAPLQAEVPLGDQYRQAEGLREADGNSVSDVLIVLKDSDKESLNNNNNGGPKRNFSVSLTEKTRGTTRHVADVAKALLSKSAPRPGSDALPPDLQLAAERLIGQARIPREKAELVVARSPWAAAEIMEQLDMWLAYRKSPAGANLDDGRFPWLIAARIEAGDACPQDVRGQNSSSKYDGYVQPDLDEQEQDQ